MVKSWEKWRYRLIYRQSKTAIIQTKALLHLIFGFSHICIVNLCFGRRASALPQRSNWYPKKAANLDRLPHAHEAQCVTNNLLLRRGIAASTRINFRAAALLLGLIKLGVTGQCLVCLEIETIVAKSTSLSRGHVHLHIVSLAADHAGVVGKLVVGIKAVICAFEFNGVAFLGKVFNVLGAIAAALPVFTVD
ncbi:MAG: hypothetical protein H7293_19620 [Candidatus Saccharibacteria bacterium]|nr:hypothetical protein [Rhodoferax sp.]